MKKTTTFLVVSVTIDGKHFAYVLPVPGSDNLVCVLQRINGITSANICSSKREAQKIADFWNECYRKNGTYMYS